MIKTTVTLTCDRCGREIKAGDRYYVEEVDIFHRVWNGTEEVMAPDEEPEHKERDLCEECRIGLYGPVIKAAEPETVELPEILPEEPPTIAEDVETGEAVELDGKTYTEYQPEPTLETREVAERIVAMGKQKKRLTDSQKEQIVRMMQDGTTMEKAAKTVGCSPQTVCNVWHKYNASQEAHNGR